MIESLAEGRWLTSRRIVAVSVMMVAATVLAILALLLTARGTLDWMGRPLGTDFSNVWTAGRMALEGRAAAAWDWPSHHLVQQQAHRSAAVPFYGWHYPPPYLLVAALLATLPYLPALILWQSATLVPALFLASRIVQDRRTLLVALGFPAVFTCLLHGYNGFLTAALLGGGLALLDRRPILAGLLIGCLVYKPQFALLLPLVLVAGGHWRALVGAAVAALLLVAATLVIWGWPVWAAFIDSLPLTRTVVIEQGNTGWPKIQSAFAAVRMWHGDVALAYGVQSFATMIALAGAVAASRWMAPAPRNGAILAAALLSTPYVLDYDFVVLGVAIAWLVADGRARGYLRWELSCYALAWATPLVARTLAAQLSLPLGLISAATIFALAMRRGFVLDGMAASAIRSWPFRHSHGSSVR